MAAQKETARDYVDEKKVEELADAMRESIRQLRGGLSDPVRPALEDRPRRKGGARRASGRPSAPAADEPMRDRGASAPPASPVVDHGRAADAGGRQEKGARKPEKKPVSQKQIEANRRNAKKSTGPKTPEGKAAVARNAASHGLSGHTIIMPETERERFGAFREATFGQLEPDGHMEAALVERIAVALWRLRRAVRIESEMIDYRIELERNRREVHPRAVDARPAVSWGEEVWEQFRHHGAYENFRRYEAHLERSLYRSLHELQRLQRARHGDEVPPPAVLDIDITRVAA